MIPHNEVAWCNSIPQPPDTMLSNHKTICTTSDYKESVLKRREEVTEIWE